MNTVVQHPSAQALSLQPLRPSELTQATQVRLSWLWHGYLAPGKVTAPDQSVEIGQNDSRVPLAGALRAGRNAGFEELLRVAGEVRAFPLLGLDRRWSPHVAPILDHLERVGFEVEIVPVEYEFQQADDHTGNRMLRVLRPGGQPATPVCIPGLASSTAAPHPRRALQ